MESTPPLAQPTYPSLGEAPLLAGLLPASLDALGEAAHTLQLSDGEALFAEGTGADALYVVREGCLHAAEPDPPRDARLVRVMGPGALVDGLQELGGGQHPVAVRAVGACVVTVIPGDVVDRLVATHPDVRAARDQLHRRQALSRLSSLVGPVDEALLDSLGMEAEWLHLHRGEVLWEPGAPADHIHIVISGRMALLLVRSDGGEELHAEVGRGETIGEGGFFGGRPRSYRARAVRDSVLVGYTIAQFERFIGRHPQVVRHITAGVAARASAPNVRTRGLNAVTTVALVAASRRAPITAFAAHLSDALRRHGQVLHLTAAKVDAMITETGLADAADDSPEEQRLLAWLDAVESRHRIVVYETDPARRAWSRRAVRRADRVVLVADALDDCTPSPHESSLLDSADEHGGARVMLVLLHADGASAPTGTRRWLEARPFVADHHHLRWMRTADMQRLARVLAGRAIGLVLGGGGARGFAHIGLLRALGEAGIPIDAVGGTSMGASVAGQYAMGRDPDTITAMSRRVFLEVKPHRGFTLPILSLVNSRRSEQAGHLCYGDVAIEDLWLPFFCVSSSLTTAEVMVHRRGTLWRAALASTSLPGIGIPVLHNRHLLVDGAVLNNLPTDVMRRLGYGTVMACVVSAETVDTFTCERVPTQWEVVRARLGRGKLVRFPSILDVVLRATLLHSVSRERLSVRDADVSVRPPVARFGLLDFEHIDEIVAAGYAKAHEEIARWRAQSLPLFP